jgi:uncharacterized protein
MTLRFIIRFSIFFVLYILANYYVYSHICQYLHLMIGWEYENIFVGIFALLSMLPFITRFEQSYISGRFSNIITLVGYYWLGAIYYFVLSWLVIDVLLFVVRWLSFFPEIIPKYLPFIECTVLLEVFILLVYGSWNARHPHVQSYDILISKEAKQLPLLNAVLISDLHLGVALDNSRLNVIVDKLNSLNPDIIFLAGDTIEETVKHFKEQKMIKTFKRIHSRLGIYAVLGNHEYIGGESEQIVESLREAGITVLRDNYMKIANQFYVVGRDDRQSRVNGKQRLNLATVMAGIDHTLPIVLLDHQPYSLEESIVQKVDLQLSGHTHSGQLFPLNLLTRRIFEIDWGHLKKDDYQIIVSSGLGTWGPPIRLGNFPEIVNITIRFKQTINNIS